MSSSTHLVTNLAHGVAAPVHRCFFVAEILRLIFEFVKQLDEEPRGEGGRDAVDPDENDHRGSDGKKALASLARTCQSFSIVALDVLWRVLDSLDPLLTTCPSPEWPPLPRLPRTRQIWGRATRIPASIKRSLAASLERCPGDRHAIFPQLTALDWRETSFSSTDDSGIPLFRYFTGPAVTTIALSFIRLQVPSASEWATLSDLPNLCPNVTSFTSFFSCPWVYDPSQQVGEMASQWKKLRSLRSCAIPQLLLDKLASQHTLETLGVEINSYSPHHMGWIPDTVRELLLSPRDASLCTRYLENVHGSPTTCCLFVGMNHIDEAEVDALFRLLPLRLDTSRLERLTIQPRSVFTRTPLSEMPTLRTPLISPLAQFTRLRVLDMDLFCTSHVSDAEYARLVASLSDLRHLKIGTATLPSSSSVTRPRPAASVVAVVAVVTCCPHLETLAIAFDGTIPPPPSLLTRCAALGPGDEDPRQGRGRAENDAGQSSIVLTDWGAEPDGGELVLEGWPGGAPNERIAKMHVGQSPIADATALALASCLKSIMPRLKEIDHHGGDGGWGRVQAELIQP